MVTMIPRPQSKSNQKETRRFALLFVLMLMLLAALPGYSQQINGTLTGVVRDQQGALIVNSTVTATNVDTGFTETVPTNGDGLYRVPDLPVGSYTLEATAPGFKKFLQKNVVLTVDQTEAVNITLAVGAQSETVTVTQAPPLVNVTNEELGRIVEPEEIIGLPLVNRDANAEISLTAGVQSNTASASSNTPNFEFGLPSTQVIVNGGIDSGVPMVSFYLDGAINMTGMRNYGNPLPNPDALQEFQVKTANFSAEYGRMSGAVVTAVTKSGTDQFHGSLFEFFRNTHLNASPWNSLFNAPYHRNQFGGVVGGPIRRDKAFFFLSVGGLRQTIGQQLTGGVVPTALERVGNFSQSKVLPVNPATGQVYTYNGVAGWIPPTSLDPTAAKIINNYIPLANSANNAYSGYYTGPLDNTEYLGKYDEVISDKDHLALSYFALKTTQDTFGGGNIPYNYTESTALQQNASVSEIHTLSPVTANQAWVTFTRVNGSRINLPATGMDDLGSTFTTQGNRTLPQLSISGYFGAGGALAGPVTVTDFYSLRDMVSTTKGKHNLDYGVEMSLDKDMAVATLANFGVFTFTGAVTKNALADFLTGQPVSMEQDTPYKSRTATWYTGLFLQDNYRILPRLTLNMGLRYDISTPPTESENRIQTFIPGVQSVVVPSAPLGLLYPGDAGVSRGIVGLRLHHVSPRFGLVWDPFGDGKTAIRAGAGIFYSSISSNEWNQPAASQPFAVRQTFTSIASFTNVYGNPASFPNGDPFPYTFNPKSPRFLPAAGVVAIAQNYQWPLVYQINAAVERQLPSQISVTAAYVGTLSHHMTFGTDLNNPVWAPGATTAQASINARRPYDQGILGQIWYIESNQTASYHSLQLTARKPLSKRLLMNGYYVYSKSFVSANPQGIALSTAQDFGALWEERGPSNNDYHHMVSASGIWHTDYYSGNNAVLKHALNGWSLSPILTLRSGPPLDIADGADVNENSYGADRPDLVPGVNPFLSNRRSRSLTRNDWFNAAAFKANAVGLGIGPGGTDGNTPRNYLRSPGYRDVDLGLFRDIHLERGLNLQLRAESTNVFNMVSLNAPTANLASSLNGHITSAASPRLIQLGARVTF